MSENKPSYKPLDAKVYPRAADIRTFMRLPNVDEYRATPYYI